MEHAGPKKQDVWNRECPGLYKSTMETLQNEFVRPIWYLWQCHTYLGSACSEWVIHPPPFAASRASFRSWLGCAPIAADQIGKAVWHPLWLSLRPRLSHSPMDLRKKIKGTPSGFSPNMEGVRSLSCHEFWVESS